jgi:hypothetical protein
MTQDGEERIFAGAALSWHVLSAVNPVPTPETTVTIAPDVGVSVKVPVGPAVKVNVPVADLPVLPTATIL